MKVAVFGLGYVGCVSAASFAARGHDVTGVDTQQVKVTCVNEGRAPVVEPGLDEAIAFAAGAGRLHATTDGVRAAAEAELSVVCVGTPSLADGRVDLSAIERVVTRIGAGLRRGGSRQTVVIRSTVLPGTTEELIIPLLEESSRLRAGLDFGVAVNPEFLREGTALADFAMPPKTVIGQLDPASGEAVAALFRGIEAPQFRVALRVAELAKYVDNAFHALKVAFANEVGSLSRALGVDSYDLLPVFLGDRVLNVSEAYLRPGFAFGGSCLPKDLRAVLGAARKLDVELPLLESILPSNELHLERARTLILGLGRRRVGLLGLAFKRGTDDLRESPLVRLAESLLDAGLDVRVYEPALSVDSLSGGNLEYAQAHLPQLGDLLVGSVDELMAHAEVCVVGSSGAESIEVLAAANGCVVVDLVRLPDAAARRDQERYVGVAW